MLIRISSVRSKVQEGIFRQRIRWDATPDRFDGSPEFVTENFLCNKFEPDRLDSVVLAIV